jgi:transposase
LQNNQRVRFHFTPTCSSWLNQVELWFAKIHRDVIDRGVFTSVADLARKLRRYIRAYEKSARLKYSEEVKISEAITLIRTPLIDWTRPQFWCDLGSGSGTFTIYLLV